MLTLDQLPTEIIQEILSYTSSKDTLTLAKVCRRLNGLALLHFFRDSCDLRKPSQSFTGMTTCGLSPHKIANLDLRQRKSVNAFTGLSILFSMPFPSMEALSISVQPCFQGGHLRHLTKSYQRLARLVKRLSHVRTASFTFNYLDFVIARRGYAAYVGEGSKQRRDVTAELLNTILEKGCEELILRRSSFIPQQMGPRAIKCLTGFQKLKSFVFGGAKGPSRAMTPYLVKGGPVRLPTAVRQSCKLKKLEISGIMLLFPPFSYWTYSVLDTPSLTSLKLHSISLDQSEWGVILSWLYHPLRHRLLELVISSCYTVPNQALVKFFSKLEALTHFHISMTTPDPIPQPKDSGHFIFFPKLVSITAPAVWFSFLCPESIPRPALKYIHVNCPFRYRKSTHDLRALLNPSFPPPTSGPNPEQSAPHEVEVEIVLDTRPGFNDKNLREDFLQYRDRMTRISGFEAYDRVTNLWLHFRTVPVDDLEMFCQFLEWWKRLQVVQIITPISQRHHSLTEDTIRRLVKIARIHCPRVQKFVIHGKEYLVHES